MTVTDNLYRRIVFSSKNKQTTNKRESFNDFSRVLSSIPSINRPTTSTRNGHDGTLRVLRQERKKIIVGILKKKNYHHH
jgi:hypothetical protein